MEFWKQALRRQPGFTRCCFRYQDRGGFWLLLKYHDARFLRVSLAYTLIFNSTCFSSVRVPGLAKFSRGNSVKYTQSTSEAVAALLGEKNTCGTPKNALLALTLGFYEIWLLFDWFYRRVRCSNQDFIKFGYFSNGFIDVYGTQFGILWILDAFRLVLSTCSVLKSGFY